MQHIKKIRTNIILLIVCIAIFTIGVFPIYAANNQNKDALLPQYVPGKIVVKFKSGTTVSQTRQGAGAKISVGVPSVDSKLNNWNVKKVDKVFKHSNQPTIPNISDLSVIYELEITADLDPLMVAQDFSSDVNIEYAEPLYFYKSSKIPFDPEWGEQKYLQKVEMQKAWDLGKGSKDIIIAVIDDGVDWHHEDLAGNIWLNMGEDVNGDGRITDADINNIDDDQNGYVDDFRGWDFLNIPDEWGDEWRPIDGEDGKIPDNDPMGLGGHGTHVAGIASAVVDNGVGIAGASWGCPIMALRTGWESLYYGGLNYDGYKAIVYAVDNGAKIINLSWGGGGHSKLNDDIMTYAYENNVLIVASAGNDYTEAKSYPARYEHVLAVVNTNSETDIKSFSSSYGDWVEISAPGTNILSTLPGNLYGSKTGTSMASPLVAGIAGLVWSQHPEWDSDRVAKQLIETADPIDDVNPQYAGLLGSGRINAYRAMTETPFSIHLESFILKDTDENNNGLAERGETIQLFIELKNDLDDVESVSASISTENSFVSLKNTLVNLGVIEKGQTVGNINDPFLFSVSNNSPLHENMRLKLDIFGNNRTYHKTEFINIILMPLHKNQNVNNINFTLTGFGCYGKYIDAKTDESQGDGFQFPKDSANALRMGSFWAGMVPDRVSDCLYNKYQYDWETSENGELAMGLTSFSDQDGCAVFDDLSNYSSLGLKVVQKNYAWNNPADEDYVILEYTLINESDDILENIYTGLFMDWDIDALDNNLNTVGYDAQTGLGYMTAVNNSFYGTCVLYPQTSGFRAIDIGPYNYDGDFSDSEKYNFLNSGFTTIKSNNAGNWSDVISAGPFTLAPDGTQTVSFAVLGGNDLDDIKSNVIAARSKYAPLTPVQMDIDHTPLHDTEDIETPHLITANISSTDNNINSAVLYWKTSDEKEYSTLSMSLAGENTWSCEIPGQTEKKVQYFIQGLDESGRSSFSPVTAPLLPFSFYAGVDTVLPNISDLTVYSDQLAGKNNFVINALIDDNTKLDTTQTLLSYQFNNGPVQTILMNKKSGSLFSAEMVLESQLPVDSEIRYYVTASDMSQNTNTATSDTISFVLFSNLLVDDFYYYLSIWDFGFAWDYDFDYDTNNDFVTDSPDEQYEPDTENILTLTKGYNLNDNEKVAVSFQYILDVVNGDSFMFQASRDSINWQTLRVFDTSDTTSAWKDVRIDMDGFTGIGNENVQFRFNMKSNSDELVADGVSLDNIYINIDNATFVPQVESVIPAKYMLYQNYPNPFNPETTITFELQKAGKTNLSIYNVLGHKVATIIDTHLEPGTHQMVWNGRDQLGNNAASGLYFYRFQSGQYNEIKKMILIR